MAKYTTKDPIYKHIQKLETQLKTAGFEDGHEIFDEINVAKQAIECPSDADFQNIYASQESGLSSTMIGIKSAITNAPQSTSLTQCIKTFNEIQNLIGEPNSAIAPQSSFHQALAEQLKDFQTATSTLNKQVQSKLSEHITSLNTLLANIPTSGWATTHADAQIIKGVNALKDALSKTNTPEGDLTQLIDTMLKTASPAANTERQDAMRNV